MWFYIFYISKEGLNVPHILIVDFAGVLFGEFLFFQLTQLNC